MTYITVEVDEKTLEFLTSQNADKIELGLKYIDHQKRTERGPLDVLCVDSGNALIIAELKVVEDDNMLVQGIDYYEDVTKNIELLARLYNKTQETNIDPTQKPRLFLIAPSFSINLLKRSSWIDIPISLFTYKCIKIDSNQDVLPIYHEVNIPRRIQPIEVYTVEQRMNYIQDEEVKNRFKSMLNSVREFDSKKITVDAVKNDVSVKVSGKVISYICPRRKNFIIYTYDTDSEWKPFSIDSMEDSENALRIIKMNFEKFKK